MAKTNKYLVLSSYSAVNTEDCEELDVSSHIVGTYDDLDEVEKAVRKKIDEVIQEDVFCWSDVLAKDEVERLKSMFEIIVRVKNNTFTKNELTQVGFVYFYGDEVCLAEYVKYYVLTL